jgi:hypothetical protein
MYNAQRRKKKDIKRAKTPKPPLKESVNNILSMLADEETARIPPPAAEKDLEDCLKVFPMLPDEYINFLRKCNGFSWKTKFYGTRIIPETRYVSSVESIFTANETYFKKNAYPENCLLIGKMYDFHFFYDIEKGKYISRENLAGYTDEYETFEALFVTENRITN